MAPISPRRRAAHLAALCATLMTACSSAPPSAAPPPASATSPAASARAGGPPAGCSNSIVVEHWPLARRAAQLVAVPSLGADAAALTPVIRLGIAGVLLLGNNEPRDLREQLAAAQQQATPRNTLLVMADEEGGGVQRLAGLVPALPWARQMAATMSPTAVQSAARRTGRAMRALGVTVDLAPVLDVDSAPGPNGRNPDGSRSFSGISATASRYGVAFMRGLLEAGEIPVVKHFPGLGGSTGNTDLGSASTVPAAALRRDGLPPFAAAITAGAPAVMVSNASVPGVTSRPASLSRAVIAGLLRHDLRFQGAVVTDSLSAGAISAAGYGVAQAAVQAISAGADIVLFGSTLDATQVRLLAPSQVRKTVHSIVGAVASAVRTGRLPVQRLDEAVTNVLTLKGEHLCR